MTDPAPPTGAAPAAGSAADPEPPRAPAVRAGVPGLRGGRADLPAAALVVAALAVLGVGVGLLWVWLAPRAQFTVTSADGGLEVTGGGLVDPELFMGDDGVYVLLMAGLGVLAGLVVWLRSSRRGVVTLLGVALGMLAASVTAWQVGALLGRAPSADELSTVGTVVTTALDLNMRAALAVGPFVAVLVQVVAAVLASRDDLGRADAPGESSPGRVGPAVPE
ncbi:DUF2567 domain-containing protein [Klenkia sp. LSe6-5]|uniref:DUF2567 domain-containing protein n=1 Tax=Klenkia sesuvii TaxID=3103137 RepID=A0ABU8DRB0_9ACTN